MAEKFNAFRASAASKLAALRERWAMARGKLTTWWATNPKAAAWVAAAASLLLVAMLLATCATEPATTAQQQQQQQQQNQQPATHAAASSQAAAIADLQANVDYLLALAAAQQAAASSPQFSPQPSPPARQQRNSAQPMPAQRPMPQGSAPAAHSAAPASAAWGTTDLDRAIANFTLPTAAATATQPAPPFTLNGATQ